MDDQPDIKPNNIKMYDAKAIEAHWQDSLLAQDGPETTLSVPATACIVPRINGLDDFDSSLARIFLQADATARFLRLQGKTVHIPVIFNTLSEAVQKDQQKSQLPTAAVVRRFQKTISRRLSSLGIVPFNNQIGLTSCKEVITFHQRLFQQLMEKGILHKRHYLTTNHCEDCRQSLATLTAEYTQCPFCHKQLQWTDKGPWLLKLNRIVDPILKSLQNITSWPKDFKKLQRTLVGRKSGIEVTFKLKSDILDNSEDITVFINQPELILSMGFLHLRPDNPTVPLLAQRFYLEDIDAFKKKMAGRMGDTKKSLPPEATLTGIHTINPVTLEPLPVLISSVLSADCECRIGTPAYNEQDRHLANKFKLPIREPFGKSRGTGLNPDAVCRDPEPFKGQTARSVQNKIIKYLIARNTARKTVTYRLHAYVCTNTEKQGIPAPVVDCPQCGVQSPETLPFLGNQPDDADLSSWSGRQPVSAPCPKCQKTISAGFSTLDWQSELLDPVVHLLTMPQSSDGKLGLIGFLRERDRSYPFLKTRCLLNTMRKKNKSLERDPMSSIRLIGRCQLPPSESLEALVERWGTDVVRTAFMTGSTSRKDLTLTQANFVGTARALARLFHMFHRKQSDATEPSGDVLAARDSLLFAITPLLRRNNFQKAFIALNTFIKFLGRPAVSAQDVDSATWRMVAQCLYPMAPMHGAELYKLAGGGEAIQSARWPAVKEVDTQAEETNIAVFINGRLQDRFNCPMNSPKKELGRLALSRPKIQDYLHGQRIKLLFTVNNYLVNIVPETEEAPKPQVTPPADATDDAPAENA